ncbi:MAG: class II aldolase/adducin family protein [Myxococcales bacterium]|nr:class II aldolase/adducin family protein [Myxococcales bacterium]
MNEAATRRALVRYSHLMHALGWVANHDGNLSCRIADDRIVCTPTAFSKADVTTDDLLVVDGAGQKLAGAHRPFGELPLHLSVYAARPKVSAVVHTHSPYATAFGATGRPLPHPFLPEAVVSLGAYIPTVALTAPGAPAVHALRPFLRTCDAVLIAGNGVLTFGPDLETAWLRAELVEHLCKIALLAAPLGGVTPLPEEMVKTLVERRAAAGLAAPDEGKPPEALGVAAEREHLATAATRSALKGLSGADAKRAAKLSREASARLVKG